MKTIVSVMFRLLPTAGGITRVAISRCKAFADKGILAYLALLGYDASLRQTIEQMREDGRLHRSVKVVNLYTYFANISDGADVEDHHDVLEDTLDLSEGREIRRYTSYAGRTFLEELAVDGKVTRVRLILPDNTSAEFDGRRALHTYWLERLVGSNVPAAVISDAPRAINCVLAVTHPKIARIGIIHSNHLEPPRTVGSPVVARYRGVIENYHRADAVVVLTKKQKAAIAEQFGDGEKWEVIANPLAKFKEVAVGREPNLIVFVGRLQKEKQVPLIVQNFAQIVQRVPNARLEIWGAGDDEPNIISAISANNLSASVAMKGYATDVVSVFARASISVGASLFEGFGLTLAESLSAGTPVVSFDTDFGPAEIVTDGEDGFIVTSNDQFVDRVCLLLSDEELAQSFGENAKTNVQRFSSDSIISEWINALDRALKRRYLATINGPYMSKLI